MHVVDDAVHLQRSGRAVEVDAPVIWGFGATHLMREAIRVIWGFGATHLMREAIRVIWGFGATHLMREAIRVIWGFGATHLMREAIRGLQRPSEALGGHLRPSDHAP
jgi:hypothetical protein